jgi:hypothetical protein
LRHASPKDVRHGGAVEEEVMPDGKLSPEHSMRCGTRCCACARPLDGGEILQRGHFYCSFTCASTGATCAGSVNRKSRAMRVPSGAEEALIDG